MPIGILFYHRVADSKPNPWTISQQNFSQHLDWLTDNFDVVSLAEAQLRIRSFNNNRPAIAISFDDGYAENCDYAIPELERRGIPTTYFVATDAIENGQPFAHDVARGVPLSPNTVAELQDMARAGIAIGGHTRSHIDLGPIASREQVTHEILGGVRRLEEWGLGPIPFFSFPFGLPKNISQLAIDVLHEAGLEGFCSAYGAWNWPGSPGVHLRRIHAEPGMQTLKNWLTLDPRKLCEQVELPFEEPDWNSPWSPSRIEWTREPFVSIA